MAWEIQISCPWHGGPETLSLPDNYNYFEGEVLCGARRNDAARLYVQMVDGQLRKLETR